MVKKIGLIAVMILFIMPISAMGEDVSDNEEDASQGEVVRATKSSVPKEFKSYSAMNVMKAGAILGGTNALGAAFEYQLGSNAVGLNIGPLEFSDILFALQVKRYFNTSRSRPYVGLGIEEAIIFSKEGSRVTFLNIPIGYDWNIPRNHFIGLELDLKYPISVDVTGDSEGDYPDKVTFLPGFYYKWGF